MNGLQQRKTIEDFSEYITLSVNIRMVSLGGTTSIQTILDIVPRCLKHVWCYRSHSVPCAGFQVLKVVDLKGKNPMELNVAT
jgi:hypothetical protein